MKAGMYAVLSQYSHVSYGALLEAYDVYRQDFDFERIAGYHFVRKSSLPYLRREIDGVIVALKDFYARIGDRESYLALDQLLRKHAPYMYDDKARQARHADISARFNQQ